MNTTATIQQTIAKKGLTIAQIKQWVRVIEKDPWEETRGILKPYKINALRYQKKCVKNWNVISCVRSR